MRIRTVEIITGILILLVVAPSRGACQESSAAGKVGISASLQAGQFDILVPVWTGNSFSIAPSLGLLWAQDGGTDFRFGLVPRFYFRKDNVAPFIGARVAVLVNSPSVVNPSISILAVRNFPLFL